MTERRVYKVEFSVKNEEDKYIIVDDLNSEIVQNDDDISRDSLGWQLLEIKRSFNGDWRIQGKITNVEQVPKKDIFNLNSRVHYRIKLNEYNSQQIKDGELFVCRVQYTLTYSFTRTVYTFSPEKAVQFIQYRFNNKAEIKEVKDITEDFIEDRVSYYYTGNGSTVSNKVDEYEYLNDD